MYLINYFVSSEQATNYIRASEITAFLRRLKPPLGISENESYDRDSIYFKDQSLLEIAVNEKKNVHIINVARQVAKRLVKAVSAALCHKWIVYNQFRL
jgi:hypothetical protein